MRSAYFKRTLSIAIIGPPASGKGTISKWLARDFGAEHVSTGDLLRKFTDAQSISKGFLASDTTILKLLSDHLTAFNDDRTVLLDGFPRRKSQAEALADILDIEAVLLLDISIPVLIDRITDRWIHPASGRTYSATFYPPKTAFLDDLTGEPLERRQDDLLESFKIRLHQYEEHIDDIRSYYRRIGILHEFTGSTSKEIYDQIIAKMTGSKFEKMASVG